MKRLPVVIVALTLSLVACLPFQARQEPAPGVVVDTVVSNDEVVLALVSVERLGLLTIRLPGVTLVSSVPAGACVDFEGAVECSIRNVNEFSVTASGSLRLPAGAPVGVACFDAGCRDAFEVYVPTGP